MKILRADFKKGYAKIKIDQNDDLWCLESIVEPGDFIKARTLRSVFMEREKKRIKTGKKPMVLKIQVEKIEFHEYANSLRLTGKIVEGSEEVQLGSYHTIEAKVGKVLTIHKKQWKRYQIEKLKKARTKIPEVLIVAADSSQATFGLLKRSGVKIISELRNPHSIKDEDKLTEFYKKIVSEIVKFSSEVEKTILAGPGFAKEHVQKIIKDKHPDVNKKLIMDTVSSATESGINEVLKKGTLDKVVAENEIVEESRLIREFLTHLQKEDGLSVYGSEETRKADDFGAIKTLLVSEKNIRKEEVEELAHSVEKKNGRVKIISDTHELGERFNRMGGLGAILRFRIS